MTSMKIAVVTEDGKTLSSHFGMAPYYRVITLQDGQVTGEITVDKPHHTTHPDHSSPGRRHAHQDMFAPIADCQVLLCGGMGQPAFEKAIAANLQVIMVGGDIASAVRKFVEGRLVSDLRRIHRHS